MTVHEANILAITPPNILIIAFETTCTRPIGTKFAEMMLVWSSKNPQIQMIC
jgi:hypothetical protein